jgi:hypothetical protein
MRYFDYKPAAYVNVHPDIPVEWMQSQLDLSQKRKDIQRAAVDKEVELLKNIKYGELGKDLYQQIKSAYEEPFKKMSEELSLTGNVSEVSRKFSETVRDLALDERVKDLQKEYQAYEQYQKNLMDPAYANAINMLPYAIKEGIQIGEEMPTSQALQYYQLTPSKRSLQPIEETVRSLHASKIDDNNWEFKDPLTGNIIRGGVNVKGLSEKRIKETLDSYYPNWNISGDSLHDKQRILMAEGLHPINDMGIFNTPEGKKLYDKHAKFLLGYAYEEDIPATSQDGAGKTKTPETKKEANSLTLKTSSSYGNQGNGFVIDKNGNYTNKPLMSLDSYEEHEINLSERAEQLETQAYQTADPNKRAELLKEVNYLGDLLRISTSERKNIEKELFYHKTDPKKVAKIEETVEQSIQMLINAGKIPEDIEGFSDPKYLEWKKTEENKIRKAEYQKLGGEDWEKYKRYEQYLGSTTSGKAYVVTTEDDKKLMYTLLQDFINKGDKFKDLVTNKETNIDDIFQIIPKKVDSNGNISYDYTGVSYEIILDELDGPILAIHGLTQDDKRISKSFEVPIQNFTNTNEFFATMLSPEEQAFATKFTQASQSLKTNQNKTGSFSVNTLDGSQNNIDFSRQKIGDGKYGYVVKKSSDGTEDKMYGSMEDMIYNEILPYSMNDMAIKMLYGEMNAALKNKDYNQATEKLAAINKLLTEGKLSPQTKKDPLGLGK